tara:strand:+ start:108 stop:416 length:309 start_codon:yes stop_codon:yes gene_type:complete
MKEKDQIAGPEYFLFRGNPEPYKSEGDKNQNPPEQVVQLMGRDCDQPDQGHPKDDFHGAQADAYYEFDGRDASPLSQFLSSCANFRRKEMFCASVQIRKSTK